MNGYEAALYRVQKEFIRNGRYAITVEDIFEALKKDADGGYPDPYKPDTYHTSYGPIHRNTITKPLIEKFHARRCKIGEQRGFQLDNDVITRFEQSGRYENIDYTIRCKIADNNDSSDSSRTSVNGSIQHSPTHTHPPVLSCSTQLSSQPQKSEELREQHEDIEKNIEND